MNWQQIPNTNYAANELGQIKNLATDRILKPVIRKNGYLVIVIDRVQYYAHRLVLWAFTGYLGEQANHRNRNKLDNALDNLEWTTCKQNIAHYRHSLIVKMEEAGQLRLIA